MYINLLTIKMYKKFPLKKILNSKDFYLKYINQKNNLLQNINFVELNKIISLLKKCFKSGNILYTCGNGGSSSLADHFTCDFIKQTNNETNLKVKSISLASNFSLISAIANDTSYDQIFSFQIEKLCKKNDILFLFSVSGNSLNLIEAIKKAKKLGVKTVSFTGFNGGKISKLSDFNLNFPIANFGIVEDCHISIMHYLSQYLRNINLNDKNFQKIYF
jgi:D-sedoheptulose 7-phosphate isomerase